MFKSCQRKETTVHVAAAIYPDQSVWEVYPSESH